MLKNAYLATLNFADGTGKLAVYTDSMSATEDVIMKSIDTYLDRYKQSHPDVKFKMLARHQPTIFNVEVNSTNTQPLEHIVTAQVREIDCNLANLAE